MRIDLDLRRLRSGDEALAAELFAMMAEVFETPNEPLGEAYLARLLARPDFWALAALEAGKPIGGVTAHELLMTRSEARELFVYDVAVRVDRQRRGVGRALFTMLRAAAAREHITTMFVPVDNEDEHALDFYRAIGGEPSPVTFFTFEA